MRNKKKVVIVGAGASGMMASVFAAQKGAEVTLLERRDRVGKKILSTGNGKCNLTNRKMDASCYRSGVPEFPMEVIGQFPVEKTLDFFRDLGILFKDRDGYIYPWSGQASAVLDVLRNAVERAGVRVVTECEVTKIAEAGAQSESSKNGRYRLETSKGSFSCDALILAAGSQAAPVTGSDGSGYRLARGLGHHVIKPLPALVQLRCRETFYKQISGVRADASVTLYSGRRRLASDQGELQLTDYGISGIPVFQVSRFAARELDRGNPVTAVLDFYPEFSAEETLQELYRRKKRFGDGKAEDFFTGWLHKKIALLFLKMAGIRTERAVSSLTVGELETLVALIKEFRTEITATNSFEQAQICCGGADVREINPETMESRKKKGLYLTGELLDVDGICGGYNLQWAWSTGAIAGSHAGE